MANKDWINTGKDGINKREMIKKIVSKNKAGLTPEQLEREEKAMIDIFEKGMLPAQALGFSQEFLDYVYQFAYSLYQKNQIEEASQLYRWLKRMMPIDQKYTIALIQCLIQQKKWLGAISCLMELAYFNLDDPMPFKKMSDCLSELGDLPGALVAIDKAITRAEDKKEYAKEKEKWILTYEHILSQLKIDPAIIERINAEYDKKTLNKTNVRK